MSAARAATGSSASARRHAHRALTRIIAALVAVGLAGSATAHAYLSISSPRPLERVAVVEVITLGFTMEVEMAFSRFELLRLSLPDHVWPADPGALTDTERMQLNALVAQQLRDRDTDALIETTIAPARRTLEVTLTPSAPLAPGAYAVTFEVLAVDGHSTSESLVFFVGDGED